MDKTIKKLWVDDLRANGDLQGREDLYDGKKFCCLGRLCQIYIDAGNEGSWSKGVDGAVRFMGHNVVEGYTLPPVVRDWAGLESVDPIIDNEYSLVTLNDGISEDNVHSHTFAEIADLIEKNL